MHVAQGPDHQKMQKVEGLAEPMECRGESAQLDDADVIWHKRRTSWIVRRPTSAGQLGQRMQTRTRYKCKHRTEDVPDGDTD